MTRDEWLWRLNALAGEHIKGWTWWTFSDGDGVMTARLHETMEDADPLKGVREAHPELEIPESARYTPGIEEGAEVALGCWAGGDYTGSFGEAWTLLERLMEDGMDGTIDFGPGYMYVAIYDAAGTNFVDASAPSVPLAITLAALKAVGVEIPPEPEDGT